MKKLKKMIVAFLTLTVLVCLAGNVLWAAEEQPASGEEQQMTADNMNFDVIFAIDGSGSMKKSDALKLRLTAGRLFTELAASNTSRAGYVQFTNIIMESAGLTDLAAQESKEAFRNKLAGLKDSVKGTWDTDISLGLTEALRLLKDGGSFGNDRNPVIILLSDGNTDLPSGPRTVEESNAELTSTLAEAAQLGVPIYSIGLNWDGKLDIAYMENIAGQTGGEFYNITTASDFNQYMTQIFGNVADGEASSLTPQYENGRYETNFVIDNSSVLTANIVILTDKGVSDPQLTDPNGNNVPLDAEHGIIVTTDVSDAEHTSTYTILKIMYPEQGVWKVSVKGEADDAIKINLLTTYDISFVLSSDENAVAGQDVTLTGRLTRAEEEIKDSDLLDGAVADCTIVDNKGNVVGETLPMTYDEGNMVFTYTVNLERSGNYYVTAKLEGRDGSFSKQSSQYQLSLERAPIGVTGNVSRSMWCNPIKTTAAFNLGDVVSCESVSELNCNIKDPQGSIIDVDYNKDTGEVTLTPLTTGEQDVILSVSDEYGQSEDLHVSVTIKPSWIWFVIGAVVLVLLIVLILIIKKITEPVLKEPVTIELSLPPMLIKLTPAPATLTMPAKKSEVILGRLIQSDSLAQGTFGEPIMQANLSPLLEKVKLVAGKGGEVSVKILPKMQGMVLVNNQNIDVAKGAVYPLRKGEKLGIQFSLDGTNSSIVYLTLGQDTGWNPTDDIFGRNTGNFGGNEFGSPFGGGNNSFGSQSGFGSPFGGSQGGFGGSGNQGGFGGFGGSGNQGGFGGFGGSGSQGGFVGSGNGNQGGFGGSGNGNQGGFGGSGNGNQGGFGGSGNGNQGGFGGSGNGNQGGFGGSGNENQGGFGGGEPNGFGNSGNSDNSSQGFGGSNQPKGGQGNSGFNFGGEGSNGQNDSDDGFGGFF